MKVFPGCFRRSLPLIAVLFLGNEIVLAQDTETNSLSPSAEVGLAEEATPAVEESESVDELINKGFGVATGWFVKAIFSSI